MAYELVPGPENRSDVGTLRYLRFGHIYVKAAVRQGEAPESELSYSGKEELFDSVINSDRLPVPPTTRAFMTGQYQFGCTPARPTVTVFRA